MASGKLGELVLYYKHHASRDCGLVLRLVQDLASGIRFAFNDEWWESKEQGGLRGARYECFTVLKILQKLVGMRLEDAHGFKLYSDDVMMQSYRYVRTRSLDAAGVLLGRTWRRRHSRR